MPFDPHKAKFGAKQPVAPPANKPKGSTLGAKHIFGRKPAPGMPPAANDEDEDDQNQQQQPMRARNIFGR